MLTKNDKDTILLEHIGNFKPGNHIELQYAIEVLVFNYIESFEKLGDSIPIDMHAVLMRCSGVLNTIQHKLQSGTIAPFEKQEAYNRDLEDSI